MATQLFRQSANTHIRDKNKVPITDATVTAVPFVGVVGNGLTIDLSGVQSVAFTDGEGDVSCTGTGTRTAIKLTNGDTALVVAP